MKRRRLVLFVSNLSASASHVFGEFVWTPLGTFNANGDEERLHIYKSRFFDPDDGRDAEDFNALSSELGQSVVYNAGPHRVLAKLLPPAQEPPVKAVPQPVKEATEPAGVPTPESAEDFAASPLPLTETRNSVSDDTAEIAGEPQGKPGKRKR